MELENKRRKICCQTLPKTRSYTPQQQLLSGADEVQSVMENVKEESGAPEIIHRSHTKNDRRG